MTRKDRLRRRNSEVQKRFTELCKKHPQWRIDALISEVADSMFLSTRTIEAILRGESCYIEE